MDKPTEKYVIRLSLDDYVQLTGVFLGNARDELILSGDEENKELINKAIEIIDNNLVVEEKLTSILRQLEVELVDAKHNCTSRYVTDKLELALEKLTQAIEEVESET